ncbi:sensor histidine kinase, partial [Streptomyces viridochromogenes]|uniref:sensor histidine kinase n=1 Tax=Streptomyces viridochromogenes TaxID=1938 RepID=UPI00055D8B8F
WTRPVPLVDVLRAAASEVEQYERIELSSVPTTEVAGRVVNDLVHLLAELLENATSFSSPQTKVKVTGHALPDGRVLIEIHDTGIGLSPEDLAAINERLASPPTVDVSVSRRMGLFVVGRLSQRHGIRIQLRPSDSGGTTALVMLPVDVAQGGKKPAPGKPGPNGPGSSGGPAAAQAAAGAAAARRQAQAGGGSLGAGAPGGALGAGAGSGGRLGAGQGPRAALPGRDGGGLPGGPGAPRGPQGPGAPSQGRGAPAGAGAGFGGQAPGAPQGLQAAGNGQDAFGSGQDPFGGSRGASSGRDQSRSGGPSAPQSEQGRRGRQPQLPPRGGARAELPGGNQPSRPRWSDENAQPPVPRASLDAPRGHDEDLAQTSRMPRIDDRQGPGSTSEFARPDFDAPAPGAYNPQSTGQSARPDESGSQNTGQFVRSDVFGTPGGQNNSSQTGQFAAPQGYDSSSTGQHSLPGHQSPESTGQFDRSQVNGTYGGGSGYGAGQPPVAPRPRQRPARQEPEALPPATGPGDGRTPLYDTLETNWFHGGPQGRQPGAGDSAPAAAPQQEPQAPAERPQPSSAPQQNASTGWRSSPNDDLVRQAERVRQPAAGGVTTSGLPRRVPRANLVPGTAQQQQHQTGPQVSRAPDDVRGRLTNLRRGIAQGRQAGTGTGQTGSFPSPTHQQER